MSDLVSSSALGTCPGPGQQASKCARPSARSEGGATAERREYTPCQEGRPLGELRRAEKSARARAGQECPLGATGRICTTGADGGGGRGGRGLQRAQGRAGGSGMDTVNMGATEQGVQVEAWHQPQGGSLRPRPEATAHKSHWVHWSHTNLHRVRLMGYQRKCKLEWGLPSSNRVGKDLFPFLKHYGNFQT